jgi:hypothetical protein
MVYGKKILARINRASSVEMSGIDSEKIHLQRNEAAMSEIASLIVGSESSLPYLADGHHFMMRRFMIFNFSEAALIHTIRSIPTFDNKTSPLAHDERYSPEGFFRLH